MNPTGCIRTEPFDGRKPYDMFSFLMSRYRLLPKKSSDTGDTEMIQKSQRRATSMDLPMAMRFRKLKEHSREAVGVYRYYYSREHRWGINNVFHNWRSQIQIKIANIFLPINFSICFGCSKEPSH